MISRLIVLPLLVLPLFLVACGGGSTSPEAVTETEATLSETSPVEDSGTETIETEPAETEPTVTQTTCIAEQENVNYTDEYCAPQGERGLTTYIYTKEMLEGYSGVTGRLVITVTGMGGVPESEGQYFIWIQGKDGGDTHVISSLYHGQPETTRLRHTPWINNSSKYKEYNSFARYDYLVDKVYTFNMTWDRNQTTLTVHEGDNKVMYQELSLSRPFSHVYEVRVGTHARNIANLGSSFNVREMRLTFYE